MQGAATSTATTSSHISPGHGSSATITPAAARPANAGSTRPCRSDSRPMNGLSPASSAAATRNVAPIAAAVAPSSSSRSGASTSSVPNISPTRMTSHIAGCDPRLAQRGEHGPDRRRRTGRPSRRAQRPRQQPGAGERDPAEHDLGSHRDRGGAEHRAAEGADDRRGHRRADQLAAALARRGADQPADRARPRGGAAEPLDEAGDVEHDDAVRECEGERRQRSGSRGRARRSAARRCGRSASRRAARRRTSRPDTRPRAGPRRSSRGRSPPRRSAAAGRSPRRRPCRGRRSPRRDRAGGAAREPCSQPRVGSPGAPRDRLKR